MTATTSSTRTIIQQGRLWFHFAHILDEVLRAQGSRLWVKPKEHARYGLRQTKALRAGSFILTTRLEGGDAEILEDMALGSSRVWQELHFGQSNDGCPELRTAEGRWLGNLGRPAWSWIRPLVEMRYEPRFYLQSVEVHEGALKARVVVAHFHEGVEMYLMEHYRARAEAVLA